MKTDATLIPGREIVLSLGVRSWPLDHPTVPTKRYRVTLRIRDHGTLGAFILRAIQRVATGKKGPAKLCRGAFEITAEPIS